MTTFKSVLSRLGFLLGADIGEGDKRRRVLGVVCAGGVGPGWRGGPVSGGVVTGHGVGSSGAFPEKGSLPVSVGVI